MSYRYNTSDNAPPFLEKHHLHAAPRLQAEGGTYTSNHPPEKLPPNFTYNAPSLHTPLVISAPSPRRKHHATKPRRAENLSKQKRDRGAIDHANPMTKELTMLLRWCRSNDWGRVLQKIQADPHVALEILTMGNYISTTILHQAISSKGDIAMRAEVISAILSTTPEAAKLTNGYGSMPLHAIAQRNLKMDSQTKERLMIDLVLCHKDALTSNGGIGGRTPLHIIFTDYVSPKLTKFIIENGPEACFMKDNKSCLPAHIACMRHCSPEKLRMLLAVNPGALHARNDENKTLLDLAKSKATQAHPNYALIDEIQKQLAGDISHYDPIIFNTPLQQPLTNRPRLHYYNETSDNISGIPAAIVSIASHQPNNQSHPTLYPSFSNTPSPTDREYHCQYPFAQQPYQLHYYPHPAAQYHLHQKQYEDCSHHSTVGRVSSEDEDVDAWNRSRLDSNETWTSPMRQHQSPPAYYPHPYAYRHDRTRSDGTMTLDQRLFEPEPVPTYRANSQRYISPSMYLHTPQELNSVSRAKNARTRHDTQAPSGPCKPKSTSLHTSTKSEEPAAKLLLHFSRNLNSNSDDNNTAHGGDLNGMTNESAHKGEFNHYVNEYSSRYRVTRETIDASPSSFDLAKGNGFAEV